MRLTLLIIVFFAVLGIILSNGIVWILQNNYSEQQLVELHKTSEKYDKQLQAMTNLSLAVGGLKTLGLSDVRVKEQAQHSGVDTLVTMSTNDASIKEQAKNEQQDDDPSALAKLAIIQRLFSADSVYIVSNKGRIVANQTNEKSSLVGAQIAFRPYFQQAMKGIANVYPAVGTTNGDRGLYFAVPIYESDTPNSTVIGVLVMKKNVREIASLLNTFNGQALLLSPQGVVFATSYTDWLYHVMPPVSNVSSEAIRKFRQFGKLFDNNNDIKPLPFEWQANQQQILWNDQTYHAVSSTIDWSDPLGKWTLLLLQPNMFVLSPSHYLLVYGGIPLLFTLLGWFFSWQFMQFRHYRQTQHRLAMMRIALENSALGVIMTDAQQTIQWVNPAVEKMTGYVAEKIIGQKPVLFRSGLTSEDIYRDLKATLSAKQSWHGQFIDRCADGSHFWADVTISPVYDTKKTLMGYVAMHSDITEKRNTLAALESQLLLTEASSRFLTAIKSGQTPQTLAEQALIEVMRFLNIPFAAIYATLPSDSLAILSCIGSQSEQKLLTPEKRRLIDDLMIRALPLTISTESLPNGLPLAGQHHALNSVMMLPIGDEKNACGLLEIGLLTPLTEEQKNYLTNITREFSSALRLSLDLLVRQQIETRAIEAEARTRLLIEAVDDGILGLNEEGIITFANPAAAKLLECESVNTLNDKTVMQMLFQNDIQAMMDTGVMTSLSYGERHHCEHSLTTQKGKSFIAEITAIPMKTNKGWDGIVIVFRDISERQHAQQQLEAQMNELTRFTDVAIGRELKMIELKEKINALLVASGREEEYVIAE